MICAYLNPNHKNNTLIALAHKLETHNILLIEEERQLAEIHMKPFFSTNNFGIWHGSLHVKTIPTTPSSTIFLLLTEWWLKTRQSTVAELKLQSYTTIIMGKLFDLCVKGGYRVHGRCCIATISTYTSSVVWSIKNKCRICVVCLNGYVFVIA